MPPLTDIKKARQFLLTELSCGGVPAPGKGGSYESQWLGDMINGKKAWWRDFSFQFHPDFNPETAITAFRDALDWHFGQDPLLTTLDRQMMARACLRLGAWRILGHLLGSQLREVRRACPSPYRLSRVTGLAAEWSLASMRPDVAALYANESLAWGAEPHRIRSYMAYASHCQAGVCSAVFDDMHFFLSAESIRLQAALEDRQIFSLLHELRLRMIRLCFTDNDISREEKRCIDLLHSQLREAAAPGSLASSLGALSRALFPSLREGRDESTELRQAVSCLSTRGRWRDLVLLQQSASGLCVELPAYAPAFIANLDASSDLFDFVKAGPVDASFLQDLPGSVGAATPAEARLRFLCCI